MRPTQELFSDLLAQGCSFRYQPERFCELEGGGHPYPSLTRTVSTPSGDMIEELIQPVLQPIVLDQRLVANVRKASAAWPTFLGVQLELFRAAQKGELSGSDVALIRGMCTEREWKCGLVEPGYRTIHPFIRLDAVLTDDGFKVIDINSTRPAGVGDLLGFHVAMNGSDGSGIKPFPIGCSFSRIVSSCVGDWASAKHLPGESIPVDIVVRHTDGDWNNFRNLSRQLARSGLNTRLIEPDELRSGEPSAIVRGRIKEGDPAYAILQQGYPNERCVMSPLYRRFLGNKVWMYLFRIPPFSEHFKRVMGEAYQLFDRLFPPIGLFSGTSVRFPEGFLDIAKLDRQEWVLKDPASSSGRRMYLGYLMGKKKWADALAQMQDGWIVQRFYRATEKLAVAGPCGEPIEESLFTKYGIYIFGSELAGLEFNARKMPVVHGARNTYCNAVYETAGPSSCAGELGAQ